MHVNDRPIVPYPNKMFLSSLFPSGIYVCSYILYVYVDVVIV